MVQVTHNLKGPHMWHAWSEHTCVLFLDSTCMYTHAVFKHACVLTLVHACKTKCMWSICHKTILLTTGSALSFIIYACRTILGGIVTNILGHPRLVIYVTWAGGICLICTHGHIRQIPDRTCYICYVTLPALLKICQTRLSLYCTFI